MIKVYNRSIGNVSYELPEFGTRRFFNIGETKEVQEKELEALSQQYGGLFLLKNSLLVQDKEWVKAHFDAPIEYWWKPEKIKKSLLEDDLELFKETLDYAPQGVIDYIILFSWQIPLKDLNKIQAIREKTGFDVMQAIEIMKKPQHEPEEIEKPKRRRRQEDE